VLTVSHRRGFTLVEIVISVFMMLIVSGAVYRLLVTTQRLARTQAERVQLQSGVRAGSLVVMNDLRELSTLPGGTSDQNDILRAGNSDIIYRAMRGIGFICQAPAANQVRIARNGFSGHRDPQPGRDSALVFLEGTSETDLDSWLPVAVANVSTTPPCPGLRGPAITLTTSSNAALSDLPVGTPVRIFEVMELRLYQAQGKSWLGARSVGAGEAIQPVAGPLADGAGFRLDYLDGSGAITNDPTAIKSVRATLRGISEPTSGGFGWESMRAEETLTAQVALRNAFRR
jgi:prepilin-type N-terminal cleavage/methylation domain-containing protein